MNHVMLSEAEALERILAAAAAVAKERVGLRAAPGRVLAEDVVAPSPHPPADTSAMDGYALAGADCRGAGPFRLAVVGESRAGAPFQGSLAGGACRIFTGAWMPAQADCVVIQENVERDGDAIVFQARPEKGQNVRRQGEDLAAGNRVLASGTRMNAFHVGLLASVERTQVLVARRPRVAVLASGSELRMPGSLVTPGSIPESNTFAIAALAEQAGAEVVAIETLPDALGPTEDAIRRRLAHCDLLVSIGGVSVGDHDLVKQALESAGVELDFWKVAIKPGKPLVFGRSGASLVLGLPGNPVSAQVTFCLFGLPLLRRMQGATRVVSRTRKLRLAAPLRQSPGRRGYYRVRLDGDVVTPLSGQSSGSVLSMADADGLAIVPADSEGLDSGELVEVVTLADL